MKKLFPSGEVDKSRIDIKEGTFYFDGEPYEIYPIESDEPHTVAGFMDDKDYETFKLVDPDGKIVYYTPNNIRVEKKE